MSEPTSDRRPPPPVPIVVTSPPWACDEPPSPKEQIGSTTHGAQSTEFHISDTSSLQSNLLSSDSTSRWWAFTPRTRQGSLALPHFTKPEKKSFRDIWISTSSSMRDMREDPTFVRKDKEKEPDGFFPHHRVSVPTSAQLPTTATLSQTVTPGWDTPWSSQPSAQGPLPHLRRGSPYGSEQNLPTTNHEHLPKWDRKKKQIRSFILSNAYVPLLFRFINIVFTTAALAMAIRIRNIEIKNNAMGAVGSSPTVVVIFAPLTLVHVMVAIYLEYFGRPLGLWHTSAKLAHTLSEVLFICAWSAALSLCFDNFFTSMIPCASLSSTSWYNQLPRPPNDIPGFEGSLGDRICDFQLSLICLVAVGLTAYCINLVISLYRVFEKLSRTASWSPKASRIRHFVHHPSIKLDKGADNAAVDVLDIAGEDIPVGQTISEPVSRSKKSKQTEKHKAFMQKLEPSARHFSKSHERRMKRKVKEQLAGNMGDLQTILTSLHEDIPPPQTMEAEKPPSSAPKHSGEIKHKASSSFGKIGQGTSSTLSKAQRKQQLKLERLRHPLILANPDFASNPFQTIRTHARNTLITREFPS